MYTKMFRKKNVQINNVSERFNEENKTIGLR